MIPQHPASETQAPVRRSYRDVVRGGTTENLHSKDAEARTTVKINKSSQKSRCVLSHVNEASTGLTCHVTEKVHSTTEQSVKAPAAKPTELPNHSTQPSHQAKNGPSEQWLKLAKKSGDGCESSQQTSGETVTPRETKTKKKSTLKGLNQNQPNKNTRNVPVKEEVDGKQGQVEKEKQDPGINPEVPPERKVHTESRWQPFTVNQSCSHKVRCRHNPGRGLPPNVQKWSDECPNYLFDPPLVSTAQRETQEEAGDSHQ